MIFLRAKEKKGITLIALVITIIVLLILAGVTIAALSGDNGILTRAKNAKEQTEKARVIEQARTDLLGKQAERESANITKIDLKEALEKYFISVPEEIPDDLTGFELKAKDEYGGQTIKISDIWNGAFTPLFAELVTSENYGNYVDYPIDLNGDGNTTNDWRIFYSNEDNIFIIAADCVENTSIYLDNAGTGMTANTSIYKTYGLVWNPSPSTAQTVDTFILDLFYQSWTDYSKNENGRCVSTLLNTNNWSRFVDSRYAEYAIGEPTLEMWVASYNAKGYTPLYTSTNSRGYLIGNTKNPTNLSTYYLKDDTGTGYDDTLYFPHQSLMMSDGTKCFGYWLASPGSGTTSGMVVVCYSNGRLH